MCRIAWHSRQWTINESIPPTASGMGSLSRSLIGKAIGWRIWNRRLSPRTLASVEQGRMHHVRRPKSEYLSSMLTGSKPKAQAHIMESGKNKIKGLDDMARLT